MWAARVEGDSRISLLCVQPSARSGLFSCAASTGPYFGVFFSEHARGSRIFTIFGEVVHCTLRFFKLLMHTVPLLFFVLLRSEAGERMRVVYYFWKDSGAPFYTRYCWTEAAEIGVYDYNDKMICY